MLWSTSHFFITFDVIGATSNCALCTIFLEKDFVHHCSHVAAYFGMCWELWIILRNGHFSLGIFPNFASE